MDYTHYHITFIYTIDESYYQQIDNDINNYCMYNTVEQATAGALHVSICHSHTSYN